MVGALGITEQVDPLIRLYDTHDLSEVVAYDALFATRVGAGVLVVSSLDHSTQAGQWVLGRLASWFGTWAGAGGDERAFPATRMEAGRVLEMTVSRANTVMPLSEGWRFRTDPGRAGEALGWMLPGMDDGDWDGIECGRSWESQGHGYDGMAWYRLRMDIPAEWEGGAVRLVAEGVDDAYRVWVNGEPAGLHGSFTEHGESVWLRQTVTDLTEHLVPGGSNLIALQVVDITGQGGVYKPLYLAVE